jgi:hypothetical protein
MFLVITEIHSLPNTLVNFMVNNQTGKKISIENQFKNKATISGDTDLCFVSILHYQATHNRYKSIFRVREVNSSSNEQIFEVFIPCNVLEKVIHESNHEFHCMNIEFILTKKRGIHAFLPHCYKLIASNPGIVIK